MTIAINMTGRPGFDSGRGFKTSFETLQQEREPPGHFPTFLPFMILLYYGVQREREVC